MPAKNFLNPETKEKLQIALKEHEHPDIRERVLIFLLLNEGKVIRVFADSKRVSKIIAGMVLG